MKKYLLSVLILLLALPIGCQKTVDADNLLDTDEKVLIIGFLSPNDTVLKINVSKALPAVGTALPANDTEAFEAEFLIVDALVSLSDEAGNRVTLDYSQENKSYLADPGSLPIETGNTYFLSVEAMGKQFTASCRIPEKVGEITHQVVYRNSEFDNRIAEISLAFPDFKDAENFYMLGGTVRSTFAFEGEEPQSYEGILFFDTDRFLTDNIGDGETLSGSTEIFIGSGVEVLSDTLNLQVAHVEEILFQQMRAAKLNEEAGDGNPFVEYSITPNNILDEGAVGIFAGYQLTEKEVVVGPEENP